MRYVCKNSDMIKLLEKSEGYARHLFAALTIKDDYIGEYAQEALDHANKLRHLIKRMRENEHSKTDS